MAEDVVFVGRILERAEAQFLADWAPLKESRAKSGTIKERLED